MLVDFEKNFWDGSDQWKFMGSSTRELQVYTDGAHIGRDTNSSGGGASFLNVEEKKFKFRIWDSIYRIFKNCSIYNENFLK
jgi:hypothetical protein